MFGAGHPDDRRKCNFRLRCAQSQTRRRTFQRSPLRSTGPRRETEAGKRPSNLAVIGRYILTPEVFETLSTTQFGVGGELQLTDGLCALLKKQKMYAYVYEGRRHDTGDKLGFLKATIEFALKRPDLGEELRKYLKDLK